MKKFVLCGMIALVMLSLMPNPLLAASASVVTNPGTPSPSAEALVLLNRLDEIKALDKSELTSTEKKELRKEVKSIKKELKTMNQGVYLSVGAIIIIVLLLILLL